MCGVPLPAGEATVGEGEEATGESGETGGEGGETGGVEVETTTTVRGVSVMDDKHMSVFFWSRKCPK